MNGFIHLGIIVGIWLTVVAADETTPRQGYSRWLPERLCQMGR